jgi:hypothetical protein
MNIIKLCFASLLVGCVLTAHAGFDEGTAAYKTQEYATALKEWQPLAEKGEARAQFQLGGLYGKGEGVKQDYAEALKWLSKAAEQGYVEAQTIIGFMYYSGQGVKQDYVEALRWSHKAADQGNAMEQSGSSRARGCTVQHRFDL